MNRDAAMQNHIPSALVGAHSDAYAIEDELESIDEELLRGAPCAYDAVQETPEPSMSRSAVLMSKGVCLLPSCTYVNFMIRGDNGELRWLTASGLKETAEVNKHNEEAAGDRLRREQEEEAMEAEGLCAAALGLQRRVAGSGLGFVNIGVLRQQIFDESLKASAAKACHEAQRKEPNSKQPSTPSNEEETLWVIKYTPKRFRDLLSDDATNLKLLQWMKSWDGYMFRHGTSTGADGPASVSTPTRPDDRIAVLVGPPGVGKTTLAHVVALHCGYEPIEINASVDRTSSGIVSAIQLAVAPGRPRRRAPRPAAAGEGVRPVTSLVDMLLQPKCLIIDEMDGITANFASFLLKQDIHCPVLCLCNDYYVPSLRLLRQQCRLVFHVPPIRPHRLLQRLNEIAERENIKVADAVLAELVRASNGDVRCCLNALQFAFRQDASDSAGTPQQQNKRQQELLRDMQGKDTKLNMWDTWRVVLERQDRNKYVQLLRKEFAMNYDAAVMAGCQQSLPLDGYHQAEQLQIEMDMAEEGYVAPGFRVDPGYTYVSRVLQQCDDASGLLDGLQEFYLQHAYTDYNFRNTRSVADAFSFQDCLTSAGYRHAPLLPFSEQYGKATTAASCFSCCSAGGRSSFTSSGFPRAAATAARRCAESFHIVRTLRDSCRSLEVASHLFSTATIVEVVPSLLRCLCDTSLRVPSHTLASALGLSPKDEQLLRAAVARHATYGFTYVQAARRRPSGYRRGGEELDDEAVDEHWELDPPVHRICCVSTGEMQQEQNRGQRWVTRGAVAPSIMVLSMKDEVRQLLAGEIHRHIIQTAPSRLIRSSKGTRNGDASDSDGYTVKTTSTTSSRKRGREDDGDLGDTKVMKDKSPPESAVKAADGVHVSKPEVVIKREEGVAGASGSDTSLPVDGSRGTTVTAQPSSKGSLSSLKDFFGRPITAKPKGAAVASSGIKGGGTVAASEACANAQAKRLTVQYIYKDGCTNAVKIPASLSDF